MSPKILLASTSPYRRELLERLGLPFTVDSPHTDETPLPGEMPHAIARRLSQAKAQALAHRYPDHLIIGSDQVASLDDRIFGKPGNHAKAVEQLHQLSGRTVDFHSGLCLLNARSGQSQTDVVRTRVTFRPLTGPEIDAYLHREQPYQCAGSAKSEGLGIALLSAIDGNDPSALIGLPLIALCTMLRAEGVAIL